MPTVLQSIGHVHRPRGPRGMPAPVPGSQPARCAATGSITIAMRAPTAKHATAPLLQPLSSATASASTETPTRTTAAAAGSPVVSDEPALTARVHVQLRSPVNFVLVSAASTCLRATSTAAHVGQRAISDGRVSTVTVNAPPQPLFAVKPAWIRKPMKRIAARAAMLAARG